VDTLLLCFWAFALLDWIAVARGWKPLEYLAKPATLLALLAWVASAPQASPWLLAALAFSLLGDVFLMLPANLFVAGLGSFLAGHLAYLGAFAAPWGARGLWLIGLLAASSPLVRRLLRAVPEPPLRIAVGIYIVAISAMVASALAGGHPLAILGAFLFMGSDLMIGWSRFVRTWPSAKLAIIVTYHLGQVALATALLTSRQ
jgi:alkenylglycerophosphocholine hydrolase